jgi:putative heme-binding domain-containing protein
MRERLSLGDQGKFTPRVERIWGRTTSPAAQQLQQEIARIVGVASSGNGDPYRGRQLYEQTCAACHKLHGQGGEIGPDLTSFKRDDLASIVRNVVDPNSEIREGYEMFIAQGKDGAVHSGFLTAQDAQRVVLRDMAGVNISLPRDQLASLKSAGRSLMPEGLLAGKTDAELRDLFAYLRTKQPVVVKGVE